MNVEIYERMYHSERDNWWFKGRRELVTEMVARASNSSEGSVDSALKILDIGCGTGLNSRAFEQFGEVYGLDISEEALRFSSSRGSSRLIRGSADDLPLKDGSFDLLCALDLLEHVEDDLGAIREFHRILKPGGHLVLTVPAYMFLWSGHDVALQHKRRYEKRALMKSLESSDFHVERFTYWNTFLLPMVTLLRFISRGRQDERSGGRYGLPDLPGILNHLLLRLLRVEKAIINRGYNLAVGVSMICICRREA